MEKKYYTKKELTESKQLLNEDGWENALMIAGFVPVIGEIADIILIIRYLRKGEYLYAGIMLIALIPTVGDFIAKPLIRMLKGPGKVALESAPKLLAYAQKNPAFAAKYIKMGNHLADPLVKKSINSISKVPVVGEKAALNLEKSIATHKSIITKLKESVGSTRMGKLGSEVSSAVASGQRVSRGVKNFFQGEKLTAYVAKHGMEPKTWISRWWNITLPARGARRNMFRQFIAANNLLAFFNLPSLDAFERKMDTDPEFAKEVVDNPQVSEYIRQTTTPQDQEKIESGMMEKAGTAALTGVGAFVGMKMLKMLAQKL
jgi:hypothetical protein